MEIKGPDNILRVFRICSFCIMYLLKQWILASPLYPSGHVHWNDPLVLVQLASTPQAVFDKHSFVSSKKKKKKKKKKEKQLDVET